MTETNNYDSWKFRNGWAKTPEITLLDFKDNRNSLGVKSSRRLYSHCSDCGDPLARIESKMYGICPMCDMK